MIITVLTIALSSAGITTLWFYSSSYNTGHSLKIFNLSMLIIPVSICVGIFFLLSRYVSELKESHLRQLQLEQAVQQRTAEFEVEKTLAEAAQFQTEQVNRQLQLSVSHADKIAQQAMEASRAKGEFLANMSHQIRTPMNAIIGFSEMLTEENLGQDQKNQVKIIRDSGRNLLQLINDILDFSKIETGRLDVDTADVPVENILAVVESLMRPAATEKGLQFEIKRFEPLPQFIRTDPSRLKQCLTNLVSNAIKFTEKGHVYVRVSGEKQDGKAFVRFDIEDTGVGIAAEKLDYVFEPFAQIENESSTDRQFGSTGLGLSITRHIAELLGGKVTVQSAITKGSTFSLYVPAVVENKPLGSDRNISILKTAPAKTGNVMNIKLTGNVLVAEDSPTNQMLIELLLKKLGLGVEIVENGMQAVQSASAKKFDVILMDIQMPVMNGYEATRQIKKLGLTIPVIALTACAMKGDDQKCFAAGCSDYLTKPIDRKKLVETLAKYIPEQTQKQSPEIVKTKLPDIQDKPQENIMQNNELTPVVTGEIELDWNLLAERIGDEELIDEIIPVFLKDNTERMQLLAEAVRKNDSKEVNFFAHSLKGASGTIGASKISDLAKNLETAGRNQQTEQYAPLFEQIKVRFDSLTALLAKSDWKQIVKDYAGSHNPS